MTVRYIFDYCRRCATDESGETVPDDLGLGRAGEGCHADGPSEGCEAVWIEVEE